MTLPISSSRGTVPHRRESHEPARLSPIMKYWPCGILLAARATVVSRRSGLMYGSSSRLPLM